MNLNKETFRKRIFSSNRKNHIQVRVLCSIIGAIFFIYITGCNSDKKNKALEQYSYESKDEKLSDKFQKKVGDWIGEGKECYGIIVLCDEKGNPKKLKEVKAKVISVRADKIKMKSLENIQLAPVEGCSKIGIKKGETWIETEGDLFQTREEVISYIDSKYPGLRIE